MTSGERRFAERLEQKLDDDYLLWYDVPIGPRHLHPDFVVMHPRRGIWILEVKDWSPKNIQCADKQSWQVFVDGQLKTLPNPAEQARQYAHTVADALKRDPQLVHAGGKYQGGLCFPWSYGVVFSNMTRKQFTEGQLDQVIEPHQVICSDEMLEKVDAEDLQSRLWGMFPYMMSGVMSLPQLDRVRWIMFPQVRVQMSGDLFDDSNEQAELPDIMRVMDIQQEQLARSLGDGHRVIHGVAGSGKTMILGYRAEYLAKACTPTSKPILILCFNEPLGVKLASVMQAKGLSDRVHVRHFHSWCHRQLTAYGQALPSQGNGFYDGLVDSVIRAVERNQIPGG
ncbi:NERD domain-containing protein, partial [Polaromonas sp.]|uniref:nuclease-related domain-containing DEAD/DEAH box helicase n=1 Tax=Polaromonas sp. TaxID=1869339 RepID=UPI0035614E21